MAWLALLVCLIWDRGVHVGRGQEAIDGLATLNGPLLELADALEKFGRSEAATTVRQWIPQTRSDSRVAYYSSVPDDLAFPALFEPKVKAAFESARKEVAEAAVGLAKAYAAKNEGELAYGLLWRAIREQPSNPQVRTILGLADGKTNRVTIRPGRTAPASLGWPDRSFVLAETSHFKVYSNAPRREAAAMAEDLERFYEIWSQVFFAQWTTSEAVCQAISRGQPIPREASHFEIALFANRESYMRALGSERPGADQSTGFYSPDARLTLLFAGPQADVATRYHEITHQLLQETGQETVMAPGLNAGFWIVEGIACYMESLRFHSEYAAVGGWESNQLQYARARWLATLDPPDLIELAREGRDAVQQRDDLGAWYTTAAAYTHWLMDSADQRATAMRYLQSVYRGAHAVDELRIPDKSESWSKGLCQFLSLENYELEPLRPGTQLTTLCLGRTIVSLDSILQITDQTSLVWLDLGGLPVENSHVAALVGNGDRLERLNLENSHIDSRIGTWIGRHKKLRELDLSFTTFDDAGMQSIVTLPLLNVLWMTGTKITSDSVPLLLGMRSLESLDIQRTQVDSSGLERLRKSLPNISLNPLQLIPANDVPSSSIPTVP